LTPDQPISLAVAVFCCILCVTLPLRSAIVPLCVAMCAYPSSATLPTPGLPLTVARVVGLVLMTRCLLSKEVRERFRWMWVDSASVFYFVMLMTSQLMSSREPEADTTTGAAISKQLGFLISAIIPFYCVRFLVVDRKTLYIFFKGFLWTAMALVPLAIYQSVKGDSPFSIIMENDANNWKAIRTQWPEVRPFLGLQMHRASAPFQQAIMFGWFFAIQVPWCTNLYFEKRKLKPWIFLWLLLPVGVISTVSSGPMMMVGLSFLFMAMYPVRHYWKAIFGSAGAIFLAVSMFAKRGVMEIVSSFGLDPTSGYYRVNLMNFVLGNSINEGVMNPMAGHWVAGFGRVPKERFGLLTDLCIQWIFLTVLNGLMGTIAFCLLVIACGYNLWQANKKAADTADKWLCWSLFAILCASLLAMQLVALFAEMFYIYHLFLALCANSLLICGAESGADRLVGVLAEQNGKQVLLRYRLKPGQRLALVRPG
jgi:hypothetical protein